MSHSGPDDNVFVNFVDHGGPDIIAFGDNYVSAYCTVSTKYDAS